jgi:peptidoglycan hydrolase-like protein with peptidoglycan-binding domain
MKKISLSLTAIFFVVVFFIVIMVKSTKVAKDDLRSTESLDSASIFESHLKLEKEDVIKLQRALKKANYYDGEINGILTAATKRAIRKFQKDHRQQVTGEPTEDILKIFGISALSNLRDKIPPLEGEKVKIEKLDLTVSAKVTQ